jgi:hypothetical protein
MRLFEDALSDPRNWEQNPPPAIESYATRNLDHHDAEVTSFLRRHASVADRSVAFTERGQQGDRKTFEPAFPVGAFLAQYRLGIQRRPPHRLPHRLMTRHSTSTR